MADIIHDDRERRTSILANVLAIAGFILLIIVVLWGLINLAQLSAPWFSSIFSRDAEIRITAPSAVTAGEPMRITWAYDTETPGTYAFLYQCVKDIQFAVPTSPTAFSPIPCGSAFTAGNATSSVVVLPISKATSSVKTTVTIMYIPSAAGTTEPEAVGSASITINPGDEPSTSEPKPSDKPKTTPKGGGTTSPKPTGKPDLAVTILSVTQEPGGITAVTFDIANHGSGATGGYTFHATLPTAQPYTYYSQRQASLAPAAHVVNTLRFSQAIGGNFVVSVDPSNAVSETNEGNNSMSRWINGGYTGYPSGYPIVY